MPSSAGKKKNILSPVPDVYTRNGTRQMAARYYGAHDMGAVEAALTMRPAPPARSARAFCRFFFNDTATTEIYTLSLHDALPISDYATPSIGSVTDVFCQIARGEIRDRKSTRLNSSHQIISYAVFCLKKKTN